MATADLMDADDALGSCAVQFRSFGKRRTMEGVISTISCFEDHLVVKQKLSEAGEGRVLVVDARGSLNRAILGDTMAELAIRNDWAGVIINGAVRDAATLDTLDLCIKALGTNPRRSTGLAEGVVDVAVAFGGAIFRPGDYLYSDEDGIVVAPRKP